MTRTTTDIDEVYREYQPRIARYVSMRIANRADAEDNVSGGVPEGRRASGGVR